jgi:tryptophan synthase alpha chain
MSIEEVFQGLREKGEGAFIPYITLGDPDPSMTIRLARTILERGGDILELGIPFSDPIADGPTIQASVDRALKAGMNPEAAFTITEEIRSYTGKPLIYLTYYNIVLQYGLRCFFKRMEDVGVQGIIIPDLPVEEAGDAITACGAYDRDLIFIIAPTTTQARLEKIPDGARGFLYLVSLLGVTGARERLHSITHQTLNRVKPILKRDIPVSVGFGISKPDHVREVIEAGADGVIVGSAIIDLIAANMAQKEKMLRRVAEYVAEMKAATVKAEGGLRCL